MQSHVSAFLRWGLRSTGATLQTIRVEDVSKAPPFPTVEGTHTMECPHDHLVSTDVSLTV